MPVDFSRNSHSTRRYDVLWVLAALLMAGHIDSLAQVLPTSGLKLHLPLFGDVRDRGPLQNHGQPIDIRFDTGRGGAMEGAAYFNGATSQIQTTRPIAITKDFTIGLWARPLALPTGSQLNALVTLEELDLFVSMGFSGDSLGAQLSCRGARQRPTTLRGQASRLGTWQHIALTRRDTIQRMYLDGQLVDSSRVCSTALEGTTNLWRIGGSPLVRQFGLIGFYNGAASNWVIYDRALSTAGIDSLIRHTPTSIRQTPVRPRGSVRIWSPQTGVWYLSPDEGTRVLGVTLHHLHGVSVPVFVSIKEGTSELIVRSQTERPLPAGVYLLTIDTDRGRIVRRVLR